MERGTVLLTNLELKALHNLAISHGCKKQDLIDKLAPISGVTDENEEHSVLISEDDAEIMLDCMPVPSAETDQHIVSSRNKIQKFIAKCRFGDKS